MSAAISLTPAAGHSLPAGRRIEPRRAAAAFARAAWFWLGLGLGVLVEQRRGLGSDHWRREAVLAAHLREVAAPAQGTGAATAGDGSGHAPFCSCRLWPGGMAPGGCVQ